MLKQMRIALMQPYSFPYIGYFMLLKHSDKFIVFDTPQFEKGGWINRNRILKPGGGFTYINAHIKRAPLSTPIKEIRLHPDKDWKSRILAQMEVYKKRAPYYDDVMEFLEKSFEYETEYLSEMNTHLLHRLCGYMEINCNIEVFSKMNIKIDKVKCSDEWGLNVSKALKAKEYLNAPGGAKFYCREKYRRNGIDLLFIKPILKPYDQKNGEFVPGLSILDVMMFNSKAEIDKMLDEYKLF